MVERRSPKPKIRVRFLTGLPEKREIEMIKQIYTNLGNYSVLTLFSKKQGFKQVFVDTEDVEKLSKICWCIHKTGYIIGRDLANSGKKIPIHRYIMNCPLNKVIDHINRNPLDNRKSNLKICTQIENMQNLSLYKNNKTGYKNISYQQESHSFIITIRKNKKNTTLCRKKNLDDAIKARNEYYRHIGKDEKFIINLDI